VDERGPVEHATGRTAVRRTWICETATYSICFCGGKKLLCAVPRRGLGRLGVDQFFLSRLLRPWLGVLGPLWSVERHEHVVDRIPDLCQRQFWTEQTHEVVNLVPLCGGPREIRTARDARDGPRWPGGTEMAPQHDTQCQQDDPSTSHNVPGTTPWGGRPTATTRPIRTNCGSSFKILTSPPIFVTTLVH
jgi:hypothetical protein